MPEEIVIDLKALLQQVCDERRIQFDEDTYKEFIRWRLRKLDRELAKGSEHLPQ